MAAKPKSLNVQRTLGVAESHLRRGAFDLARDQYQTVLDRFPKNGRAAAGLAKLKQKQARAARPELTQQMVEQVFARRAGGDLSGALAEAQLLATAYPDEAVLQNFLATCYFETRQHDRAFEACKLALKARPDYPEAHLNISISYRTGGKFDLALGHNRKAISLRPNYVAAHTNLGMLLDLMNRPTEALESLLRAVEIDPNAHDAHNNLGGVYRFLGETEKAAAAFARALELDPDATEVHCNLSDLRTYQPEDPQIAQMERLLEKTGQSDKDRFPLGFALAKAYEDIADTGRAFDMLLRANAMRKSAYPFDIADVRAHFSAIRTHFADGPLPVVLTPPKSRKQPVFVVSLPRSGTTLIEQILASHPAVFGAGELGAMDDVMNRLVPPDPFAMAEEDVTTVSLTKARDSYLKRLDDLGVPETMITDKMPSNFRWVGFIVAMFQGAKIIHIDRDPMATMWSMFKRRFAGEAHGYAYDLDDLAEYHELFRELMDFWHERMPDNLLRVNYEALTRDQEAETRRILEFLGLDWDERCLRFHETDRAVRTASGEQVRRKMYAGSSEAWKAYAEQLEPWRARLA